MAASYSASDKGWADGESFMRFVADWIDANKGVVKN